MFLLIDFLVAISVFIIGLTQVVIPPLQNKKIFPAFRRVGKLQSELGNAQEDIQTAVLDRQVQKTRREASRIANKATTNQKPGTSTQTRGER